MTLRTRILIRLAAAALFLGQFASPKPAWACSCIYPPVPAQAFSDSQAVFVGTVTGISNPSQFPLTSQLVYLWAGWTNSPLPDTFYNQQVAFTVSDSWKGVTTSAVNISTGSGGGDCGYYFDLGQQYVVYAYDFDGRGLQTNICTRTAPVSQAAPDLTYLRTLPALALSPAPVSVWPITLGAVAVMAVAGAGATLWVARRRRAPVTTSTIE